MSVYLIEQIKASISDVSCILLDNITVFLSSRITDRTVEPLKLQLKSLDQTINDQMDVIAMVKANIIRNDKRIVSMLHSVAKV